jgi:hypothetical protein
MAKINKGNHSSGNVQQLLIDTSVTLKDNEVVIVSVIFYLKLHWCHLYYNEGAQKV